MKGGFCNMKTLPIDASLRKIVSVQRNNLQRKSLLKNLNGGGHWGDFSHKMIIPGGMNFKEKAYYNLTGNYPKSVTERWHEAGTPGMKVNADDEIVQIGSHIGGNPDFDIHSASDMIDTGSHSNDDESLLDKFFHLFGNSD